MRYSSSDNRITTPYIGSSMMCLNSIIACDKKIVKFALVNTRCLVPLFFKTQNLIAQISADY